MKLPTPKESVVIDANKYDRGKLNSFCLLSLLLSTKESIFENSDDLGSLTV